MSRLDDMKKKIQQKAEETALKTLLRALKELLPEEAGQLIDEFNNPEVFEPYLQEAFLLMWRSLEIPPDEIRVVIGFNGAAQKMSYGVEVLNVHTRDFKKVEFPMAKFLSNVLNSDRRLQTAEAAKKAILYMRYFKPATDGTRTGALFLESGAPLQLNMNNGTE